MLDAILWQINDGAHPRPLLAKDANRDASQYFVDKCELSAVVTGIEKADGSYWCALGRVKRPEEGTGGADRQNTLKIFIISFTGRNIWFHVLDIYSPPLWMLICSIWIFIHSIFGHSTRTYLFTWCSTNMFVHPICGNIYLFVEFQHLSLPPLSGCWVPGFKCPSAVIWHFGDNTNQSHHDEDDKVDVNLF